MNKINIIIGSPRKNGNTADISAGLNNFFVRNKLQTEYTFLYDLDIKPCIDCRACKINELKCTIKDDASILYQNIEQSDLIVFATPIYWFAPTGKMKLFIDRLRPYYINKKLAGKKAAIILTAGSGKVDCDLTEEMFKRIFKSLGIQHSGTYTAEAYDTGDILKNINLNEEIETFGRLLSLSIASK